MRAVSAKITGSVGIGIKFDHANLHKQYESSKEMKAFFGSGVKMGWLWGWLKKGSSFVKNGTELIFTVKAAV